MTGELSHRVLRRLAWRIVPFLAVLYVISYLDRVNVSFAALTMNVDLGISATTYGWGAGIFFVGYLLFQVPGNLLLERFGPRRWIAAIMVCWGLVSVAMGFIHDARQFLIARFLLGLAEAGFFPGVILYLTYWFPGSFRGRIVSGFMFGIPIATIVGAPLSGYILERLHGAAGLAGWRWLFIVEGAPAMLGALAVAAFLPERPQTVRWLDEPQRRALLDALASSQPAGAPRGVAAAMFNRHVLAYAVAYFGLALALYGVGLWLPQMLKSSGVANTAAVLLSAIPYVVAAIGMLVWGRFADGRPGAPAGNIGIPVIVTGIALACMPLVTGLAASLALLSLAACGTLAGVSAFWTLPTTRLPPAELPVSVAMINSIGNLGGFVGPLMIGWIKDATGSFEAGMLALAAWAGVTVCMVLMESRQPG